MEKLMLKQKDAAKALGVTPRTLRAWEHKGLIRGHSPNGGAKLYAIDELKGLKHGNDQHAR